MGISVIFLKIFFNHAPCANTHNCSYTYNIKISELQKKLRTTLTENTGIFWTFGLFIMPLKIDKRISDEDTFTQNKNQQINQAGNRATISLNTHSDLNRVKNDLAEPNVDSKNQIINNIGNLISQKTEVKNLLEDTAAYKKYIKKKVSFRSFKLKWVNFKTKYLNSDCTSYVKLNRFEDVFFRLQIITLFFIQGFLTFKLYTLAIFHQSIVCKVLFWAMILFPYLLTHFYLAFLQLGYVSILQFYFNALFSC